MLHLNAKVRPDIKTRLPIEDPASLLHWLSHDRALVKFRQWITHLR